MMRIFAAITHHKISQNTYKTKGSCIGNMWLILLRQTNTWDMVFHMGSTTISDLTQSGQVTHICFSEPCHHWFRPWLGAIIWTNDCLLLIGSLGFSEIWIKISKFSHLKTLSAKRRNFVLAWIYTHMAFSMLSTWHLCHDNSGSWLLVYTNIINTDNGKIILDYRHPILYQVYEHIREPNARNHCARRCPNTL